MCHEVYNTSCNTVQLLSRPLDNQAVLKHIPSHCSHSKLGGGGGGGGGDGGGGGGGDGGGDGGGGGGDGGGDDGGGGRKVVAAAATTVTSIPLVSCNQSMELLHSH